MAIRNANYGDSSLNVYSAKVYSEHPLAIWSLDEPVGQSTSWPQYTTADFPAYVDLGCTQGVPLAFGSVQSLRLDTIGDKPLEITQERLWKYVRNDPDTLVEEDWGYWKNQISPKPSVPPMGPFEVKDWMTEDSYVSQGQTYLSAIKYNSYGMYTNSGKYSSYTAEFWMRIDPRTSESKKIWGTLNTFDGLWVEDNYITLVVNGQSRSYAVENWYRPMLVAVTYTPEQSRLVINGQEVIKMYHDVEGIDFSSLDPNYDNETGLFGFATNESIQLYEVDAIALYSYVVPDDVLKRRFVWGQGVEAESDFSKIYKTNKAYIDYAYAEYDNNVLYPDLFNWGNASLNNLVVDNQSIRTPNFDLPEMFIDGRNQELLFMENLFSQIKRDKPFFAFRPEFDWDQPSYFYFDNINKLSEPVQAVYGVFEKNPDMTLIGVEEPLMVFQKPYGPTDGSNEIVISATDSKVYYKDGLGNILYEYDVPLETVFNVGFDLNKLLNSEAAIVLRKFFTNLGDIRIYVMGDGTNTFSGFMYRFGIADTASVSRNDIAGCFDEFGLAVIDDAKLIDTVSSYTLTPQVDYGSFYLDVDCHSHWEDAVALHVLGKNNPVEDGYESKLNFFQVNIGYDGAYKFDGDYFDFSDSELNAYIGFQRLTDPVQKSVSDWQATAPLHKSRVVQPGEFWEDVKYAIKDGVVVYPPPDVPYDELKAIIYFEIKARDVTRSPFKIKKLQLSSQASLGTVEVGTLYGPKIESNDPFAIYKYGSPYLYLTKDSGIEPLNGGVVSTRFNQQKIAPWPVGVITFWVKPNFGDFDDTDMLSVYLDDELVMSLQYVEDVDDGKTFHVVSTTEYSNISNYVRIYKNNSESSEIINEPITLADNQWAFVGIEMPYPIFAGNKEGRIDLHSGGVYQGLTASRVTTQGLSSVAVLRIMDDLRQYDYQHWTDFAVNDGWNFSDLLTTENSFSFPITPGDVYNIYSGNNGILIDDDYTLNIGPKSNSIYLNVDWNTYDRQPS